MKSNDIKVKCLLLDWKCDWLTLDWAPHCIGSEAALLVCEASGQELSHRPSQPQVFQSSSTPDGNTEQNETHADLWLQKRVCFCSLPKLQNFFKQMIFGLDEQDEVWSRVQAKSQRCTLMESEFKKQKYR